MKKIGLYVAALGIFAAGVLTGIFITHPSGTQFIAAIHRIVTSSTTSASSTSYALVHCPFCQGNDADCECCHGKGMLTIAQLNAFLTQPEESYEIASIDDMVICKECNGLGTKNSKTCPVCHGEGVVVQ